MDDPRRSLGVYRLRFDGSIFRRFERHDGLLPAFRAEWALEVGRFKRAWTVEGSLFAAYEVMLVIYAALILFFFEYNDLYRTARNRTSVEESLNVSKVMVWVSLLMTTCIYALKIQVLSRFVFG